MSSVGVSKLLLYLKTEVQNQDKIFTGMHGLCPFPATEELFITHYNIVRLQCYVTCYCVIVSQSY